MRLRLALVTCLLLAVSVRRASAYSVLTHEAIVDAAWDSAMAPLLRARFRLSDAGLREARAYAYGGCIIQDIGYYPMSSHLFGNLTHYVRAGDFVVALVGEARTANELAFALGALAHYAADNDGHAIGINRSVPLLFPKLGAKFGDSVTYEDGRSEHLRTEFSFDVLQVARGSYLPQSYHDFVGFEVSKPVLERAFRATYGLELTEVFSNLDRSIGTFRWAVSSLLPRLTQAAWASHRDEIEALSGPTTREQFVYAVTRADFERDYGTDYDRPGVGTRLLGWFVRILPKIGPLKTLAFKAATPEAEQLFLQSFATVVAHYQTLLAEARAGRLTLLDRNFDTGRAVRAGEYRLADETYAALVERLAASGFNGVSVALRRDVLGFYRNPAEPPATQQDPRAWQKLQANLQVLGAQSSQ